MLFTRHARLIRPKGNESAKRQATMADDHIRYDILVQDALRSVIRKILSEVGKTGTLPGNHHFFITFATEAPGVRISSRLREKYPDQMTIVLQYQFWDLKVSEAGFEVSLSFSDVAEKLEVPFAAVRGFYDPSVNFELEFDVQMTEEEGAEVMSLTPPPPAEKAAARKADASVRQKPSKAGKAKAEKTSAAAAEADGDKPSADVVSLDAFRKK